MQETEERQGTKRKVSKEIKLKYIKLILEGKMEPSTAAIEIFGYISRKNLKTSSESVRNWVKKYKLHGEKGIKGIGERGNGVKTRWNKLQEIAQKLPDDFLISPTINSDVKYFFAEYKKCSIAGKKALIKIINKSHPNLPLCKILSRLEFPKSTYYSRPKEKNIELTEIDKHILNIYNNSKGVYGRNRICSTLRNEYNIDISEKKVYSSMKKLKIKSKIRNPKYYRESKNTTNSIPNIIKRNFNASNANEKWFTDVTTITSNSGIRSYLSIIIDTFNNEIVGWSYSFNNDIPLATKTLLNAIKNRKPTNVILHSDHGTPYFSYPFQSLCKNNNIIQSMSRIGNSLDNRPAEYFFSILKHEHLYRISKSGLAIDQIRNEIEKFMYWYNHQRIQLCLDGMSPIEYSKYKKETQN